VDADRAQREAGVRGQLRPVAPDRRHEPLDGGLTQARDGDAAEFVTEPGIGHRSDRQGKRKRRRLWLSGNGALSSDRWAVARARRRRLPTPEAFGPRPGRPHPGGHHARAAGGLTPARAR
jgi:hypothetical protein